MRDEESSREDLSKHVKDIIVEENKALKEEVELLKIQVNELNETNNHLITATWRERELKRALQNSKDIIEGQNKNISASINYSLKIQRSIIPTNDDLEEVFQDSFIYYRPKDVVSGDFPWCFKKGHYTYLAAVDCTGHGVPGAMLAIIGCLLLNDIVNGDAYYTPAEVLDKLHSAIVKTLKQYSDKNAANDGLDIALARFNTEINEVMYAGAHRPLYYFSDGEMKRIKGDKYPIGGCQYDKYRTSFIDNVVEVDKGDSLFLFSDGIPDQFGGSAEEKYGMSFITTLIAENVSKEKTMKVIREEVDQDIRKWQGEMNQLDDMLLIGIKI